VSSIFPNLGAHQARNVQHRWTPANPPARGAPWKWVIAGILDKRKLTATRVPSPAALGRMNNAIKAVALFEERVGSEKLAEAWVEGPCAEAAGLRGINAIMLDFAFVLLRVASAHLTEALGGPWAVGRRAETYRRCCSRGQRKANAVQPACLLRARTSCPEFRRVTTNHLKRSWASAAMFNPCGRLLPWWPTTPLARAWGAVPAWVS